MAPSSAGPPTRIRTAPGRLLALLSLLFAAVAAASYLSYREDNRFFRALSGVVLHDVPAPDRQEVCRRLLDFSSRIPPLAGESARSLPTGVRLYYRFGPFKPDPRSVLRYGTDPRGPCGSRSRVLAALLFSIDVPVRLTSLHWKGEALHTVVEADCGAGWAVLDPTYDLYFQDEAGNLASASWVRDHPGVFLKAVRERRGTAVPYHAVYPSDTYVYDDVYPFNWDAVPLLLPALRWVLGSLLPDGEADRAVCWPESYRRPKLFTAWITAGLSLAFLGLRWLVGRRPRR